MAFSHTVPHTWHAETAEAAAVALQVDAGRGLTDAEAASRRAAHGANVISPRRGPPAWLRFLKQFHAALVYLLIGAGVVTTVLGQYLDAGVILVTVVVNAVVGYVQEGRAARAIGALAGSLVVEATVRREGTRRRLAAAELVPGDVVVLEAGDMVPADLRLMTCRDLRTNESALTGESVPVSKRSDPVSETTELADRRGMAYAGSLVTRGVGEGLVVAIGDATQVGRISGLIAGAEEVTTPLTRKVAVFSGFLLWAILGVAAATMAVGLLRGRPMVETMMASVALAVGAVPEGLPAAVTIMLAVGVSRMATRHAIIRRLPAVEALGSTTVICSDKTGTLTENEMTVERVWAGGEFYRVSGVGYEPVGEVTREGGGSVGGAALDQALRCGALCNEASLFSRAGRWGIRGDPTEAALLVAARKAGIDPEGAAKEMPRIGVVPFESEQQYMATMHAAGDRRVVYVKGSVERISAWCRDWLRADGARVPFDAGAVRSAAEVMSRDGLRVLALALRDQVAAGESLTPRTVEGGLTFLGLIGMHDPARPQAIRSVAKCRRAGIRVKMITGDHAMTAASIAGRLGIIDAAIAEQRGVLTGAEMAALSDAELPARVEGTSVFARMTPEQKLRLVKALQTRGHVVAMTGDGVNDAPALRQADIGIAMGRDGTEVAKDAADIVLADDNFESIEAAVEEGRCVFDNLTKLIVWTLPADGGEALIILVGVVLGDRLPILPAQALYINLTTSLLMGIPLVFEPKESGIMSRPPRDPARPLMTFELVMRTGLVSLLLCVGGVVLFEWELSRGQAEASARSAAISVVIFGQMLYLFSCRALGASALAAPLWVNSWLWIGIWSMTVVQVAVVQLPVLNRVLRTGPLDASAWGRVLGVAAVIFLVIEGEKWVRGRFGSGLRGDTA